MEPNTLGFGHFLLQTDTLGRILLALLALMSVASWALVATKGITQWRRRQRGAAFLATFWNAPTLDAVRHELHTHGAHDPFSHLTAHALHAQEHHARHGATRLADAGTAGDFITRTIRKVLDEETMRMESGLTTLATVGATAPFVGLFGTVWGVYHALVAIGLSGAGTLDKVAGPVGEALIMTGLGLAVAIPAVMAYNAFARSNRVVAAQLDGFAFELHSFLTLGEAPGASQGADQGATQPRRLRTIPAPAAPVVATGHNPAAA